MEYPLVSIVCLTYNHAKFIRHCLDGFVTQITKFDFEIIIHDDASSDETPAIIKEYELKYPSLIFPIYQTVNQYANKGINIWVDFAFLKARGKYIALCEGDDFWTDILKLQKQVEFLENNSDYVLSFTNSKDFFQDADYLVETIYPKEIDDLDFHKLLSHGWFIRTATIVFVKDQLNLPFIKGLQYSADYFLQLLLIAKGKFHFLKETTSVYRRHDGGISNASVALYLQRRVWFCDNLILFNKHMNYKYNGIILETISSIEIDILEVSIRNFNIRYAYLLKLNNVFKLFFHLVKKIFNRYFG
jgi:glycosyltransferase involved in cell wall biosynthesis